MVKWEPTRGQYVEDRRSSGRKVKRIVGIDKMPSERWGVPKVTVDPPKPKATAKARRGTGSAKARRGSGRKVKRDRMGIPGL